MSNRAGHEPTIRRLIGSSCEDDNVNHEGRKIDGKCGIMTYLKLDELESFGTGNFFECLKLLPHGDGETGKISTKVLLATIVSP